MDAVLKIDRVKMEHAIVKAMERSAIQVMEWGKDDCALWVANIIQETLGYDSASENRWHYRTKRGASRRLGKGGLAGGLRRAARRHKWKLIAPSAAQPGDIGLIKTDKGPSVVICRSNGWFVGRNENGFTAISADFVSLSWSLDQNNRQQAKQQNLVRVKLRPTFCETSAAMHAPLVAAAVAIGSLVGSIAAIPVLGSFIIGTVLTVGLSYLSSLLQPKSSASTAATGTSAQIQSQFTERQPTPSKRVIFGRAYVGGALFFEQVKPPYLYMGILINHGEIAGIDTVWIGINKLLFNSIPFNAILTPLPVAGQPSYSTRFIVSFRPGTIGQGIDPIISTDFSPLDVNFLQTGIATAVFRYHFGVSQTEFTALWGQVARPSSYLLVKGVKVYDPRDPTQDVNNEASWKWSNNASLVQAYYLTRDYGGRVAKSQIDWDKVAESADYDDEAVGCLDGTFIKRYTIDGVTMLNQKPSDVMNQMLTANGGSIVQSGGKYWVQSSKPRTPIATIYDAILAGAIEVRSAQPKANMINKMQVRFVAQEQDYQTIDGPILERSDLEAIDQETLIATLELPYTLDYRRAERIQKIYLERSRLGKTISCTVDVSLLANVDKELIGEAITVSSDLFPVANGTYLCNSISFSDDMASLALVLTEYDSTIEGDWVPASDETPFTVINPLNPV